MCAATMASFGRCLFVLHHLVHLSKSDVRKACALYKFNLFRSILLTNSYEINEFLALNQIQNCEMKKKIMCKSP